MDKTAIVTRMNPIENAISCFEKITSLTIVVHDIRQTLWNDLPWNRFHHSEPACQKIKEGRTGKRCEQFEINELQAEAHRYVEGRLHRCHAGLTELALPVIDQDGLLLVLFAGPFYTDDKDMIDYIDEEGPILSTGYTLPRISEAQATLYRELLRQLGARLRCLIHDNAAESDSSPASRRLRIERFITKNLSTPLTLRDLANELHLSVERCRHVVRETCSIGFSQLLRQVRLKYACSLLLNTDLTIAEVSERCGLTDPSGFNRAFTSAYGISPGRWRRQRQS